MIASTVWNKLVNTLENNPTLNGYIKMVFQGQRFDIEPDSLPCIMLEPISDNEIEKDFNQYKNIFFTVNLFAFSSNNPHEFKKTIVGGVNYKGILDISNDIRACLQSSYDLGGNVIDTQIGQISYDTLEGKYPVRGLLVPIKILYRQQDGV